MDLSGCRGIAGSELESALGSGWRGSTAGARPVFSCLPRSYLSASFRDLLRCSLACATRPACRAQRVRCTSLSRLISSAESAHNAFAQKRMHVRLGQTHGVAIPLSQMALADLRRPRRSGGGRPHAAQRRARRAAGARLSLLRPARHRQDERRAPAGQGGQLPESRRMASRATSASPAARSPRAARPT